MLIKSLFFSSSPSRFPVFASHQRICISKMGELLKPVSPKFLPLEDGKNPVDKNSSGFMLRVISYNILAQVYVKSSYFPHSPPSCLKWKARSQAILTALKSFDADFLCIQELDEFESFYKNNLEGYGYSSIYIKRGGGKRDGCGIMYKHKRADLVLKEEIKYNDLLNSVKHKGVCAQADGGDINDLDREGGEEGTTKEEFLEENKSGRGDPNDPLVRLKRDCVGLLAAFRLNDPSQHMVIVANTHIYWDPEWIDVKLAQVQYLLLRLARFRREVSTKYCCLPSVLVAGDFNSTPGDEVYQYLTSSTNNTINNDLEEPLRLRSLYAESGGEPACTNCTPDFTGTLDYIFMSDTNNLRPVNLLHIPGPESFEVLGGLPNHYYPSDHLPIGADFEVTEISNNKSVSELQAVSSDFSNLKM